MSETILLSDLEIEVNKEIKVAKSLIRKTLNWGAHGDYNGERQSLDYCLDVAANFTWLTQREIIFIMTSNLVKSISGGLK